MTLFCSKLSKVTIGHIPDSKVHGAHLGPIGPRWAPCWPHEPCYLGWHLLLHMIEKKVYLEITKRWKSVKNSRTTDVVLNSRNVHLNLDVNHRHHRYNKWNIKHNTTKCKKKKNTDAGETHYRTEHGQFVLNNVRGILPSKWPCLVT